MRTSDFAYWLCATRVAILSTARAADSTLFTGAPRGSATAQAIDVAHPPDGIGAETALRSRLQVAGVPVRVGGRVDAGLMQPEFNRMHWQGGEDAIELRE